MAQKGIAITTDCTPRYCYADPFEGGKQAVAETWRNITAVGAKPLAITNCLNFGNPEKPRIMGQIVGALQGMAEACLALDYPIISGNVSLYNETNGTAVQPTPAIGGVGVIADVSKAVVSAFLAANESIILIGETKGHIGASIYLREIEGSEEGAPPPVDLAVERKNGDFVRSIIEDGKVTACHDISDGGLYVAIAEMSMPHKIGAKILIPTGFEISDKKQMLAKLFGEDQARYIITTKDADAIIDAAKNSGVIASLIGNTNSSGNISLNGDAVALDELENIYENVLPNIMQS